MSDAAKHPDSVVYKAGVEAGRAEAVAEIERLLAREAYFAELLYVADGGRYQADWDAAIRRVLAERDEAKAEIKALRAALEFYADESNWTGAQPWDSGPAEKDMGKLARETLRAL